MPRNVPRALLRGGVEEIASARVSLWRTPQATPVLPTIRRPLSGVEATFKKDARASASRPLLPLALSDTDGRCRFLTGHWPRT